MVKKIEIEVFGDADYPAIDSDDIAHAIATVEVLKPYVRVINRGRSLQLPGSHPDGCVDTSRLLVAHDTMFAVLGTGRHIVDTEEVDDGGATFGIYLPDQHLGIVSSDSRDILRTSRHEVGHALYTDLGIQSDTADDIDHCSNLACVMHGVGYRRPVDTTVEGIVWPNAAYRTRRIVGSSAYNLTAIVPDQDDFCDYCEDALEMSADVLSSLWTTASLQYQGKAT